MTTTTAPIVRTREEWLTNAVFALASGVFADAGVSVPKVRVSVGFPAGSRGGQKHIGQCWAKAAATDSVAQLFISPVLSDAARVLDVLIHELVHAIDDCQSGHRGRFAEIATAVGLEGKMTATVAGKALKAELEALAEELGTYPHASHKGARTDVRTSGPKTQTTRMIKAECPVDGYTVRLTQKWIAMGLPVCPCGQTLELA